MDDRSLSNAQRIVRRLSSPALFAAMERDSRLWKAECPHCHSQTSLWEMGGIRYKAVGSRSATRIRCPKCGQRGWMRIHWTGGDPNALGPRPSVMPVILRIALILVVPLLLVVATIAIAIVLLA